MRRPDRLARRALGALLLTATVGALAGCGGDSHARAAIDQLPATLLPERVLGLRVTPEAASTIAQSKHRSYLSATGLWGFREGKALQATLQIAKFTESARPEDPEFRQAVATQVGSTVPEELQMGNQTVYITAGGRQSLAVWFLEDRMYVLATRDEFDRPRTLLRDLIELER